jgi:hypothetical protein
MVMVFSNGPLTEDVLIRYCERAENKQVEIESLHALGLGRKNLS